MSEDKNYIIVDGVIGRKYYRNGESMKGRGRTRLRNDIILIGILILISVSLLLANVLKNSETGTDVIITVDGEIYETAPLSENREILVTTETGMNLVMIANGAVTMADADCPERLCVDHKAISYAGEQIVCLPHKVVVRITGGDYGDVDSISH